MKWQSRYQSFSNWLDIFSRLALLLPRLQLTLPAIAFKSIGVMVTTWSSNSYFSGSMCSWKCSCFCSVLTNNFVSSSLFSFFSCLRTSFSNCSLIALALARRSSFRFLNPEMWWKLWKKTKGWQKIAISKQKLTRDEFHAIRIIKDNWLFWVFCFLPSHCGRKSSAQIKKCKLIGKIDRKSIKFGNQLKAKKRISNHSSDHVRIGRDARPCVSQHTHSWAREFVRACVGRQINKTIIKKLFFKKRLFSIEPNFDRRHHFDGL